MIQDLQDITSFKWATVTDTDPLTIQLDGDTAPLALVPESLVDPLTLAVNDRVRVELSMRKCVIHGLVGGGIDAFFSARPPARNLIRNARFRVNQRGATSGASLADLAFFHDAWRNASGTTTSTITFTGSDDAGRVITFASVAGVLRYIRQTIERRDVLAGDYIFGQYGTAQGRVYNAGASAPAWSNLPLAVSLDGTDDVRVEFRNVPDAATATVDRPFLVRADEWSGYFPDISYAQDLAWCQRYYYRITVNASGSSPFGGGVMSSNTNCSVLVYLPVQMRAVPTLLGTAAGSLQVRTATTLTVSAYALGGNSTNQICTVDVTTSTGVAGQIGLWRGSASGHYMELSADI